MADNTTKVTYQAAANFSALSRAITNLRRQIKGLRDDQAAFNAESAAGSLSAAAASDRNTKSTQAESAALSDTKGIIEGVTAALTNAIKARDDHAAASKQMSDSDKAATGTSQALEGAVGRVESALGKAASAFDRATAASKRNRSENNQNTSSQTKLISGTQRVLGAFQKLGSYKPDIVPPFIALIPALAGVIALVNPLIGGLASVAAAAGGFASNIGSLAGAALGVVPALAGLLSLVKQYSAMKKATGGGGGGGGGGDKQIEISQAEKVARANEKYAESIQNVQFAEEDLTAARKDYIQRLNELQKAVDRAAASQKRAAANEQLAQENYANVLADPGSTKGQKMDAAVSVTEAKESVQDTNDTNKQNAADLAAMKKTGINGDRQVIEAQRAVTQAIYDERDAQIAVLNAQKGTTAAAGAGAAATAAYQDALDKLSPSARSVVLQLIAMQGAWDKLQRTVQEAFFSKVVGDIQLLRKLFPPVTSLLSDFAGVAGTVADTFLKMVTSTAWTDDIVTFGKEASPAVKDIGDGLMNILNGFRNIAIAALPFTKEIIKDLVGITEKFKNFTDTARANGSMAAFLETVRARLERWGRILINVGTIVLNYGRALSGLGDDLTKALEKTTGSWAKSSQSAAAKGSPFQKYLHDIKPLLKNINGLIGDFFGWLGKTASSKGFIGQMNDIVTVFRKDLGPAIGDILDTLSKTGIGTSLVKTIGAIVKTISTVLDNGGATALKTFFGFLQKIVELIGKAASLPGGGAVIATLVTSLGALAAITFVGKFTGLFTLFGWLLRIAKSGPVSALFKNLKGLGKVKGPDGTYSSGRGETTKTSKIDKGSKGGSAAGDVAGALESGAGNETKTSTSRAAQAARGAATSDIERSAERAAGRSGLAGRVIGGAASLALGGGAARAVSAARGAGSAVARGARDVEHYSETVDRGHFTATPLKTARRGLSGAYKITDAAEAVGKAGRGARALGLLGRGAMTAARGVGVGALASVAGEIGGDAIANGAPKGSRGASRRVGGAILSGTASGQAPEPRSEPESARSSRESAPLWVQALALRSVARLVEPPRSSLRAPRTRPSSSRTSSPSSPRTFRPFSRGSVRACGRASSRSMGGSPTDGLLLRSGSRTSPTLRATQSANSGEMSRTSVTGSSAPGTRRASTSRNSRATWSATRATSGGVSRTSEPGGLRRHGHRSLASSRVSRATSCATPGTSGEASRAWVRGGRRPPGQASSGTSRVCPIRFRPTRATSGAGSRAWVGGSETVLGNSRTGLLACRARSAAGLGTCSRTSLRASLRVTRTRTLLPRSRPKRRSATTAGPSSGMTVERFLGRATRTLFRPCSLPVSSSCARRSSLGSARTTSLASTRVSCPTHNCSSGRSSLARSPRRRPVPASSSSPAVSWSPVADPVASRAGRYLLRFAHLRHSAARRGLSQ
jgi:hypothetical protein